MNKTQLIQQLKDKTGLSKKDIELTVNAFIESVTETLEAGEKVQIVGFGHFETRNRSARKGRNPQTGQEITIPESRVPAFKAGKQLKEAVN
ncbi:HU family DNA-binding protein [Caldalkalibacillus salinus]|uniref:HU family DNA-binding protein n=1 Tax=Caldalkalibacillus salinus TaxID=2803787 RepID=UPI001920AD88|nr:HU family DNA-binding protein [Caldalkalibacillus salinus]